MKRIPMIIAASVIAIAKNFDRYSSFCTCTL
jgi:hypothetical protein